MGTTHIGIACTDEFPDIIINKFIEDIKSEELFIDIRKFHYGIVASALDWALPTMISVYILKPYFESFLQELGKDHYQLLKTWLTNLSIDSRKIKAFTIRATKASQKENFSDTQSKAFSISLITKDDRSIKLLFDLELNEILWKSSVDQILDLLLDNYENFPNDMLTKMIAELSIDKNSEIFVVINNESGGLTFYDMNRLIQKDRNRLH